MNTALDSGKALSVLAINGPINSGKSTLGRSLAEMLPDARFIDGDEHDLSAMPPGPQKWAAAIAHIEHQVEAAEGSYLVVAYPLNCGDFERLRAVCQKRAARLVVVTLNPPLETALSHRGGRKLTPWEKMRIVEMYQEGYQAQTFSNLFVDTSCCVPLDCAKAIVSYLEHADERLTPGA